MIRKGLIGIRTRLSGWNVIYIVLFTNFFIIAACHKKTLPVITERTTEPIMRNADTTALVADAAAGKTIFTNRCGRCHGLPETVQYTAKRWETIIALMSPRARLTRQETYDVLAYVKMNAKN